MNYYCGINEGAKTSEIALIDEDCSVILHQTVANDVNRIKSLLSAYAHNLVGLTVKSCSGKDNLARGLIQAGFKVHLTRIDVHQNAPDQQVRELTEPRHLASLLRRAHHYRRPKQSRVFRAIQGCLNSKVVLDDVFE